ncbi:MAG: transposase, partial [Vicingaceae bacterium]|nr:transposase [Vicingaceae bacterium]
EEVALIYKIRWQIELLFKKLKQNFQLHYFYSETENGIKTQIWITLITQLLLMVVKAKSKTKKAFPTVAVLVRIHLISNLYIFLVIENSRRTYKKEQNHPTSKPNCSITQGRLVLNFLYFDS